MRETCKRCKYEDCTPWYYSKDLEGHVCQECAEEIFDRLNNSINIGKYNISISALNEIKDTLWMYIGVKDHPYCGEGMEISVDKFEKFLDEFWTKEF